MYFTTQSLHNDNLVHCLLCHKDNIKIKGCYCVACMFVYLSQSHTLYSVMDSYIYFQFFFF